MGRILKEYGEESNWRTLQNKIVKARIHGGLHSTNDLVELIKHVTPPMKGRSFSSSVFLFVEACLQLFDMLVPQCCFLSPMRSSPYEEILQHEFGDSL